ncbi:MAG TPA: hypothetical protein VGT41_03590 [Candidatus Babeliales bacterium]|nr:hypothetical protein [Candidatus Babeliales bacterium]
MNSIKKNFLLIMSLFVVCNGRLHAAAEDHSGENPALSVVLNNLKILVEEYQGWSAEEKKEGAQDADSVADIIARLNAGLEFFTLEEQDGRNHSTFYYSSHHKCNEMLKNIKKQRDNWRELENRANEVKKLLLNKSEGDHNNSIMGAAATAVADANSILDLERRKPYFLGFSSPVLTGPALLTDPRIGVVGLIAARVGQACYGNTPALSIMKKLSGLQALASVACNIYRTKQYFGKREEVLKPYLQDRAQNKQR